MELFRPQKLFIDASLAQTARVRAARRRLAGVATEIVSDPQQVIDLFSRSPDRIREGKRHMLITRNRGAFLKKCPCTSGVIGCNYHVLNWAANCPFECSYCVLQGLRSNPLITWFANVDDMLGELHVLLGAEPRRFHRIGSGEWADSLAIDHITHCSPELITWFAKRRNAVLEIKTKSDRVDDLLGLEHKGRTVMAWSLNAEPVCHSEEWKSAPIENRLVAASRCAEAGYRIAFHLDPIIRCDDFERHYADVAERLFASVPRRAIAWISLGALRFPRELKPVIEQRFPKSTMLYDEFVPGHDGKMRYFRPIRTQLYQAILNSIRKHSKEVPVYLCMETSEVWSEVFGAEMKAAQLSEILDASAAERR